MVSTSYKPISTSNAQNLHSRNWFASSLDAHVLFLTIGCSLQQTLQRLAESKAEDALSFLINENSRVIDLMEELPEPKLGTIERGKQIYGNLT